MKLYYHRLQLELTRRCNQECAHCCRGDAQDIDLTKEVVDCFFQNNTINHIGTLLFSGGEPTLNGQMLEYVVDSLITKNIPVEMFILGINGLSYNKDMVNGLNKLQDYIQAISNRKRRSTGLLIVSQDQFHKEANPEVLKQLQNLPYFVPVEKTITPQSHLLPYGRAVQNKLSIQEPNLEDLTNYQKNYKVKEDQESKYLILAYQYLAANGNVINDGNQSYDLMDQYALGNVKRQTVEEMYLQGPVRKLTKNVL